MTDALPLRARRDLALLVESEAFGMQTYAVAVRLARRGPRREAWEALLELERQTGALVDDLVAGVLLGRSASATAAVAGRITAVPAAAGLAAMPQRVQAAMTLQVTRPYIAAFRRLATRFAEPGTRTFYDYVLDHELAIAELARRQMAGRTDAVEPVARLLGDDRWTATEPL